MTSEPNPAGGVDGSRKPPESKFNQLVDDLIALAQNYAP